MTLNFDSKALSHNSNEQGNIVSDTSLLTNQEVYYKNLERADEGNTRLIPQTDISKGGKGFAKSTGVKDLRKKERSAKKSHTTSINEKTLLVSDRLNSSEGVSVHLDYLSIIKTDLSEEEFINLLDFISKYISVNPGIPWRAGSGATYYEMMINSPNGIHGGCTRKIDNNDVVTYSLMLQISGTYFSALTVTDQWRLVRGLYFKYSCRCSRIDIAIDDISYQIIPIKDMEEATIEGNNFYFQKAPKIIDDICKGSQAKVTNYFGSKQSGKMVRVYSHEEEKLECLRYEAQFGRGYANTIFAALANLSREFLENNKCKYHVSTSVGMVSKLPNNDAEDYAKILQSSEFTWEEVIQKFLGSIAVGCIDFRDKSVRKDKLKASIKDTPRLEFWQRFIDIIGRSLKPKIVIPKTTLLKTMQWFTRQCAKTKLIIEQGLGRVEANKYMNEIANIASERFTRIDIKSIEYLKDNKEIWKLAI